MHVRNFTLLISLVANVAALTSLTVLLVRRPGSGDVPAPKQPDAAAACAPCPSCVNDPSTGAPVVECPRPVREPPPPPVLASADLSREPEHIPRFNVCERAPLPLDVRDLGQIGAGQIVSVHCGDSVQLIGFDAAGSRRIARIDKTLPKQRTLHFLSAPVRTADINGDALSDILVSFAFADDRDSPRGGALVSLLQTRSGGFETPHYLGSWTVSGLTSGRFRADTHGADIAVLQREDTRLGRQSQLVLLHAGPSPVSMGSVKVEDGLFHVDALDLDLDGRAELLLSGDGSRAELVALDAQGTVQRRTPLDVGEPYHMAIVDIDGDGHDDALFVGTRVQALLSAAGASAAPSLRALKTVPATAVGQPLALDVDGDGRRDLFALADAELVPLRFHPPDALEVAAPLRLDAFETQGYGVAQLFSISREEGKRWLVVVGQARAAPYAVDVAVSQLGPSGPVVSWNPQRIVLPDAPMSLRWTLP